VPCARGHSVQPLSNFLPLVDVQIRLQNIYAEVEFQGHMFLIKVMAVEKPANGLVSIERHLVSFLLLVASGVDNLGGPT